MGASSHQPSPQQLQPLMEAHMATWKWLTGMIAKGLGGIIVLLALMAAFLL